MNNILFEIYKFFLYDFLFNTKLYISIKISNEQIFFIKETVIYQIMTIKMRK